MPRSMLNRFGFTLTEVMVAVGVTSALIIGSINFYSNAQAKAQAQEGVDLGLILRDSITDFYEAGNPKTLPAANFNDFGADPSPYVSSVTSDGSGRVEVVFSGNTQMALSGKYIHFVPVEDNNHLSWSCETNITGGRFNGDEQDVGSVSILIPYHCIII